MKRIYIEPCSLCVEINSQRLIAFSDTTGTEQTGGVQTMDNVTFETKGISDVNLWDNEW